MDADSYLENKTIDWNSEKGFEALQETDETEKT